MNLELMKKIPQSCCFDAYAWLGHRSVLEAVWMTGGGCCADPGGRAQGGPQGGAFQQGNQLMVWALSVPAACAERGIRKCGVLG